MRRKEGIGSQTFCRILHGSEAMAAQGWSPQWVKEKGVKHMEHDFLCTLAGRAFSAYSFTPVWLATFAAIGLCASCETHRGSASDNSDSLES